VARRDIEPFGEAGLAGSDIGDEGFRTLGGGLIIGNDPGLHVTIPPPPAPPPPPPVPAVRQSVLLVGQAPDMRPELLRHESTIDGQSHRIVEWCTAGMVATIVLVAVMMWLNLTHRI
jgi:hypothetical protein